MGQIFNGNNANCPQCNEVVVTNEPKWTLYVMTSDTVIKLKVTRNLLIHKVKKLIYEKHRIEQEIQQLSFAGKWLEDAKCLNEYALKDGDTIQLVTDTKGIKPTQIYYNCKTECIVIGRKWDFFNKTIEISSYHVSCKSDKINGQNMAGIVLYAYDNQTDWKLNNVHCRSGYIILKNTDKIKTINSPRGQVHGRCYKSVFGEELNDKVIGGGFAFKESEWKFNSCTFNTASKYHNEQKAMHLLERQCIEVAIENWKNGIQNTKCSDIRHKFDGYCKIHCFYTNNK